MLLHNSNKNILALLTVTILGYNPLSMAAEKTTSAGSQSVKLQAIASPEIKFSDSGFMSPNANGTVTLTAVPKSGFSFLGWSGSCSGSGFSVTVKSSDVANCKFKQQPLPPVSITGGVFHDLNINGQWDAGEPGIPSWLVMTNVKVNGRNKDLSNNAYDRIATTNDKGLYMLGGCNITYNPTGQYDDRQTAKCLSLPSTLSVGIEQRAGWISTTSNPASDFNLQAFITGTNDIYYESYGKLDFGVFNGVILKTSTPANGSVNTTDGKINCGTKCQAGYPTNSTVTLTATPSTGYIFSQWSGSCSGTSLSLTLKMDASKNCSATFAKAVTLNVNVVGGNGKTNIGGVKSTPIGINCGVGDFVSPDCKEDYAINQSVTLSATPNTGYIFTSWSGACSGNTATTTVKMDTGKTCIANFSPMFNLTVSKTGNGFINGTGINCGVDCSELLVVNTTVTLTAVPSKGSYFSNWSGACTNSSTTCTVTMDQAKTISAVFKPFVAKEFVSPDLYIKLYPGLFINNSGHRKTSVCLPSTCQLDTSSNHPSGYIENRQIFRNPGNCSGVKLTPYKNPKGETCVELDVETCTQGFWAASAEYKGSVSTYGLCQ